MGTRSYHNVIGLGPVEAVDLDGTLAKTVHPFSPEKVGEPIERMVRRVKAMLSSGKKVVIFSASVANDPLQIRKKAIDRFCLATFGQKLPITCVKSHNMVRFWDDKAVHVQRNTGAVQPASARLDSKEVKWDEIPLSPVQHQTYPGSLDLTLPGVVPLNTLWVEVDDHPAQYYTTYHGYAIAIENPVGSERKWKDEGGNEGVTVMKHPYGRIVENKEGKPTEDADGDQVDCFLGPLPEEESPNIYIINQSRKDDLSKFDEHKVIFGASSYENAKNIYLSNYEKGHKCGPIVEYTLPEFDEWLSNANLNKPAGAASSVDDIPSHNVIGQRRTA